MKGRHLSINQVVMMFREFDIDLVQRLAPVQANPKEALEVFMQAKSDCKKEFRKKAFKVHPDRNGGDDTEFKRLNSIWQILERLNPIFRPLQQRQPQYVQVVVVSGSGFTSNATTTSTGGFW